MATSLIIRLIILGIGVLGYLTYKFFKNKSQNNFQDNIPDFYSINDGNQDKIVFAPDYDAQWFADIEKKYAWENFDRYDNKYWEYMYNIFDTLPALAQGQIVSDKEFFDKLTRGQKIFYSVLVFGGATDNGGVYQFFFNKPQFCFAILESFKELKMVEITQDYENCLNEFIGSTDSYNKRKILFNDESNTMEKRWQAFTDGKRELRSAEKIEDYFYNEDFKKQFYKTVVDYIDSHLELFVRKK
jgi:hypothetical protein